MNSQILIDEPLPEICPRPSCGARTDNANPFCPQCGIDLRHEGERPKIGTCTYCQEVTTLTYEHVFGDWLNGVFPPPPSKYYTRTVTRPDHYEIGQKFYVRVDKSRKKNPYHLKHAHLCQKCNSERLKVIHDEAKNILIPFFNGEWPDLIPDEIRRVVRWAIMVAVNVGDHHGTQFVRQHQLSDLREGKIPPGFMVSIVRMPDRDLAGMSWHQAVHTGTMGDEIMPGAHMFFCVEKLGFFISHSFGDMALQLMRFHGGIPTFPRMLHPTYDDASSSKNLYYSDELLRSCEIT